MATPIEEMRRALSSLGVSDQTLSAEERVRLDADGYINLGRLISAGEALRMACRQDEIAAAEGDRAGKDFHTEAGTTRLGSLLNKDPMFDICFLHPRVLAAVDHITAGNFGLSSLTARAAHPGQGAQSLHRDWVPPDEAPRDGAPGKEASGGLFAANALWVLDDFTAANGPTRLVPGSHRRPAPTGEQAAAATVLPGETRLLAPAGTVVVINSLLWHGGTTNNSDRVRHLTSAMFQPRGYYQPFAYRKLESAARRRLSAAAQFIADHASCS